MGAIMDQSQLSCSIRRERESYNVVFGCDTACFTAIPRYLQFTGQYGQRSSVIRPQFDICGIVIRKKGFLIVRDKDQTLLTCRWRQSRVSKAKIRHSSVTTSRAVSLCKSFLIKKSLKEASFLSDIIYLSIIPLLKKRNSQIKKSQAIWNSNCYNKSLF